MVLRIELKPGERLFIGTSVLKNGGNRTHLGVEGDLPILRDRDVIDESTCDTPIKRLYASIQKAYLSGLKLEAQAGYALNLAGACKIGELSSDFAEELGRLASTDGFRALRLLRPFLPLDSFPKVDRSDAPKLNDRKKM